MANISCRVQSNRMGIFSSPGSFKCESLEKKTKDAFKAETRYPSPPSIAKTAKGRQAWSLHEDERYVREKDIPSRVRVQNTDIPPFLTTSARNEARFQLRVDNIIENIEMHNPRGQTHVLKLGGYNCGPIHGSPSQ